MSFALLHDGDTYLQTSQTSSDSDDRTYVLLLPDRALPTGFGEIHKRPSQQPQGPFGKKREESSQTVFQLLRGPRLRREQVSLSQL